MEWQMNGTYCGPAPLPAQIWSAWNLDPVLLICLAALALFLRHSRAGLAACAVLFVTFVSPICALSAALFSARVVHHVLLVAVAAPLLAIALPARRSAGGGGAALPFLVSTATLWFWHLPAAYDAALSQMGIYWVMQLTLLGTATMFWRGVFGPAERGFTAVLWTLAGFMAMGLLGALLTFAPEPVYAAHAIAPFDWGLTPLRDQQLGGLLMWVPAGIPYLLVIGLLARGAWTADRAVQA